MRQCCSSQPPPRPRRRPRSRSGPSTSAERQPRRFVYGPESRRILETAAELLVPDQRSAQQAGRYPSWLSRRSEQKSDRKSELNRVEDTQLCAVRHARSPSRREEKGRNRGPGPSPNVRQGRKLCEKKNRG